MPAIQHMWGEDNESPLHQLGSICIVNPISRALRILGYHVHWHPAAAMLGYHDWPSFAWSDAFRNKIISPSLHLRENVEKNFVAGPSRSFKNHPRSRIERDW